MDSETESQPLPDPRKLQPEGLSNRTKRWMFLGAMGVVLLIVVANIFGSSPVIPAARIQGTPTAQQQNPTAAQLEDYTRNLAQQQAALLDRTRADAARLEQLQANQGPIGAADLQKAAALREAATVQQQYQQEYGGHPQSRQPQGPATETERPAVPDSVVHQDRGQIAPVRAPWQQPAPQTVAVLPGDREALSGVRPAETGVAKERKALDFDPSRKTYWLPEGTILEAVLTNRLEGEAAGPVNAMITTDVYLPGTRLLLIPQGARLLGEASKVTLSGQQRLAVSFHRIIVPGPLREYSIPLESKPPALAQAGETGLRDKINSHYAQIFGASLAVGAIGGLAQIGNGQTGFGFDPEVQFRNGVSQEMAQSSERILDRFLNRLPTITIREGTRMKILLTDDLQLPALTGDI
jgi:type IV secretory pathway VirB10-like protein